MAEKSNRLVAKLLSELSIGGAQLVELDGLSASLRVVDLNHANAAPAKAAIIERLLQRSVLCGLHCAQCEWMSHEIGLSRLNANCDSEPPA
jgi:hypothetical protein